MSIVYRQRVAILAAMMVVGALIISPHIGIASPSPLVTGSLNASYSTSGQPASFSTSSSATYSVTVTNTGSSNWKPGGQTPVHLSVRFALQGGGYPTSQPWTNEQRYTLPTQVSPGQSATMSVTVTAPSNPSSYVIEYQMIQEPSTWFPQYLDSAVTVNTPPPPATSTPTDTPTSTTVPSPTSTVTSIPTLIPSPTSDPTSTSTPTTVTGTNPTTTVIAPTSTSTSAPTPSPTATPVPTALTAPNPTGYSYTSTSGDYIGQGNSQSYSPPNATISIQGTAANLTASVTQGTDNWSIQLAAPTGQQLQPGMYYNAERASFKTGRSPGLDVYGNGRGCNTVYGSFGINQIATDSSGNVTLLDATFTQNCESATTPPLQGVLHFQSSPLTYFFTSDSGDFIGQGLSKSYAGATTIFGMSGTTAGLTYSVSGQRDNWNAHLTPPTGQQLQPGTYNSAQRFASSTAPGLDVYGDGRGCNDTTGTFTINAIQTNGAGTVTALNATFTQYCQGSIGALHGTINYNA